MAENKTSLKTKSDDSVTKKSNDLNKEIDLSGDERIILNLKKLYMETIKLDVELQNKIYILEKTYENKHTQIYEKRRKIIEDYRQKSSTGDVDGQIGNFWLRVLKNSYTEFICKKDEDILKHLLDIRSFMFTDPVVKFTIEFIFEPNPFFENKMLTKTYYLNCVPDVNDPLTYDGAEIYKCEGCTIKWKPNQKPEQPLLKEASRFDNIIPPYTTFFDFFTPPALPENGDDPLYLEANSILQNDFELGFYLKERVIPKAILFFTGEIADCISSDETDEDNEAAEDDDDDESSSGNEEAPQ